MHPRQIGIGAALGATLALGACNKEAEFAGPSDDKVDPVVVVDQEFPAAAIGDRSLSFQPAYGLVSDTLTLKEKPAVSATTRQAERVVGTQKFSQGHDGSPYAQNFDVSSAGKLDLLVVVDDSGSMQDEQVKLSTKLTALTKELAIVDWRIVVVTTSSSCRRGDRSIDKGDADAEAAFEAAVTAGTAGNANERGIRRAIDAFDGVCGNTPYTWLRPDSSLAVLFVSDEQNACNTVNCRSERPADLVAKMRSLRPNQPDKLRAYGITWSSNNALCNNDNGETAGTRYLEVVNALGGIGVPGSICDADYKVTLETISKDVVRPIRADYSLKFTPEVGMLDVMIDGVQHTDFVLDGKKLTLKNVPASAVKMKVSYNYAAVARFERVLVTEMPAEGTLEVWYDGKKVDPADYSFDPATLDLAFVPMPPDMAEVKVKYRQQGDLPTKFDVSAMGITRAEGVWVGKKLIKDYSFDETTGVLTLPAAPGDGAEIKISYRVKDGQITRYAGAATAAEAESISAVDEAGDPVDMTVDAGQLVFSPADVLDGRKVVVTYDYGELAAALAYEIPDAPLDGTLKVTAEDGRPGCIDNVAIDERKLVTFSCDAESVGTVKIDYQYVAEQYVDFVVTGPVGDGSGYHYQVFVDGRGIGGFTHVGGKITIPADKLTPTSKVRIIVTKLD